MPIRKVVRAVLIAALLVPTARARAAAGRITISASPRQVELEPGARATLHIVSPEPPVLGVSVGHIEDVKAMGHGSYQATYFPPRETYPQVAIVTAATSRAFGWLPLPLAGTGEVVVKTDPEGAASLTIGATRFGPVRADAAGRAAIRIVVPPGIKYAMSGGRRMSLETPDVSHVYVAVDRTTVAADAATTVLVRAFAVTPEGKPRRGAPLTLTASDGQLSPPREVEPGAFEARWTLPPGAARALTVTGRLSGEAASTSSATVSREPSTPRRIKIDVDHDRVAAGDGALEFTIEVEDGVGNAVADATPRASTSFGNFLGFSRGAPGRWVGRVAIPERLDGASKLDIVASAGDVVAERSIAVTPGPTADLTIDPPNADAAGRTAITFTVTTADRFGNPTDDAPPKGTARLGAVDAPARQGLGLYKVTYRPPGESDEPRDEITFRAGPAVRVARVRLERPRPALLEVAPVGGVAARTSGGFGPVIGGEVSLWGRIGTQEVGLALNGSWYDFKGTKSVLGPGSLSVNSEQTYVALTLSPSWRYPLGSRARIWASLGGGVTRVHSMTIVTGQPQVDEAKWVPTGTAAVSLGAKLGPGYPFIELRGSYVADPGFKNLSGSFVPIFLQAGYRFDAF